MVLSLWLLGGGSATGTVLYSWLNVLHLLLCVFVFVCGVLFCVRACFEMFDSMVCILCFTFVFVSVHIDEIYLCWLSIVAGFDGLVCLFMLLLCVTCLVFSVCVCVSKLEVWVGDEYGLRFLDLYAVSLAEVKLFLLSLNGSTIVTCLKRSLACDLAK